MPSESAASVVVTREGGVGTLALNRPDVLNVLDFAMMDALVAATAELAADLSLKVVVVRGEGRHFMAGGDIRTFAAALAQPPAQRAAGFTAVVDRVHAAIENLVRMPHPVVARVHGAVAGFGLSLMNACDLVVAAEDTYFAAAYRNIALSPDGGGTWSLPRLVGARKAAEIMLLSERFDAQEALRLGLVNRVVPAAELDAAVAKIVASLVAGPALALRNTKRLLRGSPGASLSEQLHAEALSFGACSASPDFDEGLAAFLAKRAPKFGD